MKKEVQFNYPIRGKGRPQIVLIGNGLERASNQVSWNQLVDNLTAANCISFSEEEKDSIPFPLLYEAIILNMPIPQVLDSAEIMREEERLKTEMGKLINVSNKLLIELPKLNADQIFTTNYSYCLEKAFMPKRNFSNSSSRSAVRYNLSPCDENGKKKREVIYRLHSCYLGKNKNDTAVGLWHIHGEAGTSKGIVLGHDRYGRLLKRMIEKCSDLDFKNLGKNGKLHSFTSWPELFLFGDVYVIGFGFEQCEFDLWWLLRRKQREHYGDGKVFFYDKRITEKELVEMTTDVTPERLQELRKKNKEIEKHNREVHKKNIHHKLMQAHGVQILDLGSTNETNYNDFYMQVFEDVGKKIAESKVSI